VEFNGDGKPDIFSGCYSEHTPMAGLLWLLAGTGDGTVAKAEVVKGSDGKPLIIPASEKEIVKSICTQPAAHDWDGDGDLDILTGNFEGTYYLFRNDGSKEKASFNPKPEQVMTNGKPLQIKGVHSGVCPVDWDGDGDTDILTGSSQGGVFVAEDEASGKGVLRFSALRELLAPGSHGENVSTVPPATAALPEAPGNNTRAWAADVNGDGKLDLLIGDCASIPTRAKGLSEAEFTKKQAAWQKEMDEVQAQMRQRDSAKSGPSQEVMQRYSSLYQKRREFIDEGRTGFVWLMLQK
jgi:hypothetical protein